MHPSPQLPHDGHDGHERLEFREPRESHENLDVHEGLFLGIDAGKVTTSLTWGRRGADGAPIVVGSSDERHRGEPLAPFFALYRALGAEQVAGVVGAGTFGDRLTAPALAGIPEEIAQEWALRALYGEQGPVNVVRIGGSGYSVLTRDAGGRIDYEKNERCSAGTGETVEGLCSRLGCTLDEAVALASGADGGITVTSRCAVFAKSELTHYANQGEDHGRLFRGLFESVARNVHALYDRAKVDGPVVLVGHGALIRPLVDAFRELVAAPVEVSPQAGVFEALGAFRIAASRPWGEIAWPSRPEELVVERGGRVRALPAAVDGPGSVLPLAGADAAPDHAPAVAIMPADDEVPAGAAVAADGAPAIAAAAVADGAPAAADGAPAAVVLGLDLGSTGSKALLLDPRDGAVLADVYRRTDGNPVEAAKRLIEELMTAGAPGSALPVVAVGLTGSGRDAVASVMRAAYPRHAERLTVLNEIVAHAAAAVRYDPDGGRSLSIVEIGGQDAKFINLRDGRVLESDMNRVCSAGTGSFLEEQAQAHGLDDIAQFGVLAARSRRPPDLGQTCTVFVADVAAEALADGFSRDDIFAGLQYSVIKNYIGRVMGDRRFCERIFFQGKPASNPSLARTLAAVTGREVVVPPNPGAMGALGIALLASEGLGAEATHAPASDPATAAEAPTSDPAPAIANAPFDLDVFLSARVLERKTRRCADKQCSNLCRLEVAVIEVAGERRRIVSGGNCPKYDERSEMGAKLPKDAPNPYRERTELLTSLLDEAALVAAGPSRRPLAGRRIGLPQAHYLIDSLPFFATFLSALGADVSVLRPTTETLARGDRRCAASGACAPVKIAHGLTTSASGEPLDAIFEPKFINLPSHGAAGTFTCPIAQGTPEMLDHALAGEPVATPPVVRPVLFALKAEGFGGEDVAIELEAAARLLGVTDAAAVRAAHTVACEVWERYQRGLRDIGARALSYARAQAVPVVLIVGETHVVHDPVINSGIHDLVAGSGAVALPLDCYPLDAATPVLRTVHWAGAGETLRAALSAAAAGDVFPLLLCAYGCGPNSLVEHLFDDLLSEYPHTVLETDGHGGSAGYVTRVQAFLHAVQGYREAQAAGDDAAWHTGADGAGARDAGTDDAGFASGTDGAGFAAGRVAVHRLERCEQPVAVSLRNNRDRTFLFGNIGGSGGRFAAAAMRGAGLDARFVGITSPAALDRARQGCSGKECLPYQLIWGTLAEYLEGASDTLGADGVVFVSIGRGFQSCRPNLFPVAQQIQLERHGYAGAVEVADFTLLFEDWSLTSAVWIASAAADLLNMMRFYHFAGESWRGASEALYHAYADRLEALLSASRLTGKVKGLNDARALLTRCEALIASAAAEFAALERGDGRDGRDDGRESRTVFLCGDIYLRVDEWGNDDLQRKLSDQGLRVIFEPFGEIFELLALRDARDHGLTTRLGAKRVATLKFMRYVVKRLLGVARPHEPWMFWHDVGDIWTASEPLFDGYPFGETIPTIGGALLTWATQPIDGVVVVSPRGCGPALVSEAQLRRGAEFPLLFVYNDGDPVDEARLAGFAWRLRAREPRATA